MIESIAFCGLDCTKCPAFIATQTDDAALRAKTADEWSKAFGGTLNPEDICCDGCHSTDGRLFSHCFKCNIRACGSSKAVSNCGFCDEYACDKISEFIQYAPGVKPALDQAAAGRKNE